MADEAKEPNYWMIWGLLAVLTLIEVLVPNFPIGRAGIVTLLTGLAVAKALLVALYFMHLRYESLKLIGIVLFPLGLALILAFGGVPDAVWMMWQSPF